MDCIRCTLRWCLTGAYYTVWTDCVHGVRSKIRFHRTLLRISPSTFSSAFTTAKSIGHTPSRSCYSLRRSPAMLTWISTLWGTSARNCPHKTSCTILRPCTAPLSCSLQHLLKLLFSLIQFVSIVSPHSPSLRFGLPIPQPWRHHQAQSLLGPSFHDPGTHHVLESHPEQAAPLSHRDDRCHDIVSQSALALHLHLAACSPSSSCRF